MGQYGIGQGIRRFDDARLLKGEGRFHNDVNLPGQTHLVVEEIGRASCRERVYGPV